MPASERQSPVGGEPVQGSGTSANDSGATTDTPLAHDLRMVPVAAAAWAATWLGTGAVPLQLAAGATAAGLTVAVCVRLRSSLVAAVALVLVLGLVIGVAQQHRLGHGPVGSLATARAVVTVQLVTSSDPELRPAAGPRPAYLSLRATLVTIDGRGSAWRVRSPVLLTTSGTEMSRWSTLVVGTELVTQARLEPPQRGSDVAAVVRVRGPTTVTAQPSAGLRLVERVRGGLRESVGDRRPEPRALVPALVLGDTSGMTTTITDDFQATGLTHLTAVSGANLTLLLAFLLLFARWLGVRGWWLRGVGLLAVFVFVALCRTEPSVLRAAAMGLVALAALGAGGGRKGLRTLSVAMVVLLLVDPFLSRSVGFALSVLASGGIVWWAARWATILRAWLPGLVAESVSVPLAAHLATLPVVAAISGRVSVVGVLTNALAGPFVGPATVLGFAAAGLSLVSDRAAAVAGFGAAWSAQVILWVAHTGARLPGASWQWPTDPGAVLVLGGLALLLGWLMPVLLSRPWLALLMAVVMVLAFVRTPLQPGWPPKDWVVVACDVGQGDGLVIYVAPHRAVVVDTGPDPGPMRRCLDQLDITEVPLLVLTHFHSDHVAGLAGLFAGRTVAEVWVSPLASPAGEATQVATEAQRRGVPVRVPEIGASGRAGETDWLVLGPVGEHRSGPEGESQESAEENDSSLVLMVTVRGVRILVTGDVEPAGQRAILATGADLRADVLKLPHHGSGRQEPAFVAATHARVAIASAGPDNSYGHPATKTVALVESLGMTLLRTDQEGSVAVTSSRGSLTGVRQRAP